LATEYCSIGVPPKKGKPVQAYAPKFGGKATIIADDDDDDEPVAPGPRREFTGSPALPSQRSAAAFRGCGGAAKISRGGRGGGKGGKIMLYNSIYDSNDTMDNSPYKNLE
jgi:hypothetical protein